jgi:hypothetical protein
VRRARFPIATLAVITGVTLYAGGIAFAAQYPPKAATCASAPSAGSPGIDLVVKGTNWAPNSTVGLQFLQLGNTWALGSAATDVKGKFKVGARVPNDAKRGKAAIQVIGTGASGQSLNCYTNFQVVDSAHAVAVLPVQGIGVTPGMIVAALGVLFAAVLVHRRRNRKLAIAPWRPKHRRSRR